MRVGSANYFFCGNLLDVRFFGFIISFVDYKEMVI